MLTVRSQKPVQKDFPHPYPSRRDGLLHDHGGDLHLTGTTRRVGFPFDHAPDWRVSFAGRRRAGSVNARAHGRISATQDVATGRGRLVFHPVDGSFQSNVPPRSFRDIPDAAHKARSNATLSGPPPFVGLGCAGGGGTVLMRAGWSFFWSCWLIPASENASGSNGPRHASMSSCSSCSGSASAAR